MGSENSKKGSITLLGDTWMWNGDYHLWIRWPKISWSGRLNWEKWPKYDHRFRQAAWKAIEARYIIQPNRNDGLKFLSISCINYAAWNEVLESVTLT